MTKEEAAKILYQEKSNAGWMRWVGFPVDIKKEQDYKRFILAVDVALDALRDPQPDPITGLVPCGCGGKAIPARLPHPIKTLTCVACETCFVTTPYLEDDEAKDVWNRAMGWREGNEN